ncbi:hypothetical protein [Neobacillus mesonae]|uniref:hypothetical protein n=1 Tax=Neobacillus mesonae TaxID=1193713 RepID=UPI00203E96F7|nr:hypothetical protein [Neobacillus mesonae]MCM3570191.1 hypothetical protein [Neobacillus mesonae]
MYEAIIFPLPTLTISGYQITGETACKAVVVFEQGDGTIIEENFSSVDVQIALNIMIPNVKRVFVRCDSITGGTGCRGHLSFSLSYCGCSGGCCTCSGGEKIKLGENSLNTGFLIPCGTETGPLFKSYLTCAPTVTIIPYIYQDTPQCNATLLIQLEDGSLVERDITPPFVEGIYNSPPIFTVEGVREIRIRCQEGEGTGCEVILHFVVSYC